MAMAHPLWPLFDLRLREGDLELRLPNDTEIAALCAVAREGVHDPATMPFIVPWTDKPSPSFEREFAQHHWGQRARWSPADWSLELAVFLDGKPIGAQAISAKRFSLQREVRTGSWLGQRYQGRGIGKRMRGAILPLAFEGLGARIAHSGAFEGNERSRGVSAAFGYDENGKVMVAPRGLPLWEHLLLLTRERWAEHASDKTELEGLDTCLDCFGISIPTSAGTL
jgi:RimJ/RimL family protein N-acetyltransferase